MSDTAKPPIPILPAEAGPEPRKDSFAWGALAFVAIVGAVACAVAGVALAPAALAVVAVVAAVLAIATATGLSGGIAGAGRAGAAIVKAGVALVTGRPDDAWRILAEVDAADWFWFALLLLAAALAVRAMLAKPKR